MIGRVVIPEDLPPGAALFYTTNDFDGQLTPESVAELLAIVRERFGIEARLSTCVQVHGKSVQAAEAAATNREHAGQDTHDSCDALFASSRGNALAIKVADCLPVTIFDVAHDVVANIHSGWRGAVQRITAETLDVLKRETAFDPASAVAYLGPSIRACCFEVGEEVADQFRAAYPDAEAFIDRTRAKPHVDTPGLTRELLSSRGISRVVDTGLCTRCGSTFHSYRRDKRSGRNLAVAAI
jgi:YfiH family protein